MLDTQQIFVEVTENVFLFELTIHQIPIMFLVSSLAFTALKDRFTTLYILQDLLLKQV